MALFSYTTLTLDHKGNDLVVRHAFARIGNKHSGVEGAGRKSHDAKVYDRECDTPPCALKAVNST